jgi:hypothetical protein
MVTCIIGRDVAEVQPFLGFCQAAGLAPAQRASLSVEVLARKEPVTRLAQRSGVSRKFLYQQAHKASEALEQQRDNLLAFAGVMEGRFSALGHRLGVPPHLVQQACELEGVDLNSPIYWQREGRLRQRLGAKFRPP